MLAPPHAGHRTTKTRWPSSNAGAMTVVVPHLTHGGGGGWNGSGMTNGSLIFRRERDWSLSHRRLGARAAAGDASIVHETAVLCVCGCSPTHAAKRATRKFNLSENLRNLRGEGGRGKKSGRDWLRVSRLFARQCRR